MTEPLVLDVRGLAIRPAGGKGDLVRSVDLAISRGEAIGLVGASGSGKTLTAMAIAGLLPPSLAATGRIAIDGLSVDGLDTDQARRIRTRLIGVVFQNASTALNPRLTVGAQLTEALAPERRASSAEARRSCLRLLDEVGVPGANARLASYPHELSGGLAQRVVIAIALARDPRLLIADEPTTALDVTTQRQILDLLENRQRERGFGVLLITHDMGVVADRANRVCVMDRGAIVETGGVRAVIESPQAPETKALVEASFDYAKPRAIQAFRPDDGPIALEVISVSKSFDRKARAVNGVSCQIRAGIATGIVGESGSGKTTLARIIAGLERQDEGTVRINGAERLPGRRSAAIQYVFQDPYSSLNPRIPIDETVAEPLLATGELKAKALSRARELLGEVGLDQELWRRRPSWLSGGQRQRVGIARALSTSPRLLIADEPVAALDVVVRARVLRLLDDLCRAHGATLLLISHDLAIVANLCRDVLVMRHGEFVEHGATADVFSAPSHPYTQALISSIPGRRYARVAQPASVGRPGNLISAA